MINYLKHNYLPIITAIVLFFLSSIIYFSPVLEGKVLNQNDMNVWRSSSKELRDYSEQHKGEKSYWTNSMFSGMPSYLINTPGGNNKTNLLHKVFTFPSFLKPAHLTFLYFFGFFLTLLIFGVNPWLSIIGAFAFGFSTYSLLIIEAGHTTKCLAIGYMGPIIAGIHLAFKKKELWGAITTGLFLSLQILVNHLQITYYTFLVALIYGIFQIVYAIKNKTYRAFFKTASYLLVAGILAISANIMSLSAIYEYGKSSIRGASELTHDQDNQTSGLNRDYATSWSYGVSESFNLVIPNFMGGASVSDLGTRSETYKLLKQMRQPNAKQIVKQMPTYWGTQPFTSGPTYLGVVVFLLAIFAFLILKGQLKWWLLTATLLSLFLAWGKNMMWFTDLFFDYMPGYNKFRAVSMTLVIAQFTVPLLAILGLQKAFFETKSISELKKPLFISTGILSGLIILLWLIVPNWASAFSTPNDANMFGNNTALLEAIRADRMHLFKTDILRSLAFVASAFVILWLWTQQKASKKYLLPALAILIIADLWMVDKRYVNNDDFTTPKEQKVTPSVADLSILKDKSPSYRVLNLSVSPFNDATTSHFHKSIGGYHGAKMRRYQELIDFHIQKEIMSFGQTLQKQANIIDINNSLASLNVINMLNTKYIIYSPKANALNNPYANGNAWFIEQLKWVKNADEEIAALNNINTKKEAIADVRFQSQKTDFKYDANAEIKLTSYEPNCLIYESNCQSPQVAVFSEIYYDGGWNAYIDGKLVPHFRVDYILRALNVPAGKHTITFKFEPQVIARGWWIGFISSILLILLILSGFLYDNMKAKKELKSSK